MSVNSSSKLQSINLPLKQFLYNQYLILILLQEFDAYVLWPLTQRVPNWSVNRSTDCSRLYGIHITEVLSHSRLTKEALISNTYVPKSIYSPQKIQPICICSPNQIKYQKMIPFSHEYLMNVMIKVKYMKLINIKWAYSIQTY